MITDPDGPFRDCLMANVDLTGHQEDCVFDTCANLPDESDIGEVCNSIGISKNIFKTIKF